MSYYNLLQMLYFCYFFQIIDEDMLSKEVEIIALTDMQAVIFEVFSIIDHQKEI